MEADGKQDNFCEEKEPHHINGTLQVKLNANE